MQNEIPKKAEWTWDDVDSIKDSLAVVIANPSLPNCPIVYTNDVFLEHSGYDRNEILGHNCRFMQGEDTEPEQIEKFSVAIEKMHMADIQITNYRKNGEKFINHVLLRPLAEKDNPNRLIVAVQRRLDNRG